MTTLYYGQDNAINRAVTSFLAKSKTTRVIWVCNQSERPEDLPTEGVEVFFNERSLSLEELITASLEKNNAIKQIVFAEGTGGVRPVKLNREAFVAEMFQKNVFSFFEFIRVLIKQKLIATGASIVALSSVSSIKGLKSKSVYSLLQKQP